MTITITTIIIMVLFLSQLLTFYFLVLLNSKISKYKDIEKKQEAIIREMDDAISAYLVEVKDENDRLIKELAANSSIKVNAKEDIAQTEKMFASSKAIETQLQESTQQPTMLGQKVNEDKINNEVPKIISKAVATNAYKKQIINPGFNKSDLKLQQPIENKPVDQMLTQFEQQVVDFYKSGMSFEEIAKKTQKGKTEIELLIKFHA